MEQNNKRAVVLGGGYTGLLAAKVLSKYFKEVIVIERDSKIDSELITPRKGEPQGGYAHFLIPLGINAIVKIFPAFTEKLLVNGAKKCDLFADARLVIDGNCGPRFNSDQTIYLMGRPLIDKVIRDFLMESQNISFLYETEVKGFIYDQKVQRITGVKLKDKLSTQESNLMGDLIVDATGPSSRCSEWLEEIGLKKPPIEEIQINYNQIAYRARWGDNFNPDWMYTVYRKAGLRKGGYFMRIEDDKEGRLQWLFAIVTHFGEPLEKRKEDFDNISSQLENTTFGEAVKNSIHLTELGQYRVPKIRRKIFSQMDPLPKGFIAIGDAQCIWAPHTGLGLTIGALAALALKETLENKEFSNLSRGYFKRSEQLINTYWNRSIKVVPVVDASTLSPFGRFVLWYKKKLVTYSFKDRQLWKETLGFACNEKSVGSLFYPPILLKMFLHMLGVMK